MRVRLPIMACCAALLIYRLASGAANSPVADAAMRGDKAAVRSLLAQKSDVNTPQADGATAILWAAEQAHPAAVPLLIEHGADVLAASNPDTRNAKNNLADTVTKRLNSKLGILGQARARANNKSAPGASPVPAVAGAQN